MCIGGLATFTPGLGFVRNGPSLAGISQVSVCITTETLDIIEFRDRVADRIIRYVTPLNMYAFSVLHSAEQRQALSVRIENQLTQVSHFVFCFERFFIG